MPEAITKSDVLTEFGNFAVSYRKRYPDATASEIANQYAKELDTAELHALLSLTAEHFVDHFTTNAPVDTPDYVEHTVTDPYEALMLTRIQLRAVHDGNIVLLKRFGECTLPDLSSILVRLSYFRDKRTSEATNRLGQVVRSLSGNAKVRDIPRDVIEDIYLLNDEERNVFLTSTPEIEDSLISAAKWAPNSRLAQIDGSYSQTSRISNQISTIGTWKSDGKGNLLKDSFVPNPAYIPAQIIHG